MTAQPAGSTHFRPCLLVPNPSTWAHGGLTHLPSPDGTWEEGTPHVLPWPRAAGDRGQSLPFSQTNLMVWVRSRGPAHLSGSRTQKVVTGGQASVPTQDVASRDIKAFWGTEKPRREADTSQGETL